MASLFEAIVLQNLSVLTRGHTLRPHVLLLGGPNSFIRGMREAWQANIPRMWQERKVAIPDGAKPEDLIKVPQNAQYFAALGAIEFGKSEEDCVGCYQGYEKLVHYIDYGRQEEKAKSGAKGLTTERYGARRIQGLLPAQEIYSRNFQHESDCRADSSASTADRLRPRLCCSTKKATFFARLTSFRTEIRFRTRLRCSRTCAARWKRRRRSWKCLGVATTGYAKDILKDVLHADVALVETVAHTESALKFYEDPHVIVDVGGQDIKIIILHKAASKISNSTRNARRATDISCNRRRKVLGWSVEQYADLAFSAKSMPVFGYGCAVFMQSDIVNFQRQGWRAEEILAGLAAVLPKNVFLYVASIPNLAALGTRFVLQGGTQNNMAVVKAEVDFIQNSFRAAGKKPEIIVHEFCGESGAIGAAVESLRLWRNGIANSFVGLEAVRKIRIPHHAQ